MSGAKVLWLLGYILCLNISAQISLEGLVVDPSPYEKIDNVAVSLEGNTFKTLTDINGHFIFSDQHLNSGKQVLLFLESGYKPLPLPGNNKGRL